MTLTLRLILQQVVPSYSLFGIVKHKGPSAHSGHYTALVKTAAGHWSEMDDHIATPWHGRHTPQETDAYILFYKQGIDASDHVGVKVVNEGPAPAPRGRNQRKRPPVTVVDASESDDEPKPNNPQLTKDEEWQPLPKRQRRTNTPNGDGIPSDASRQPSKKIAGSTQSFRVTSRSASTSANPDHGPTPQRGVTFINHIPVFIHRQAMDQEYDMSNSRYDYARAVSDLPVRPPGQSQMYRCPQLCGVHPFSSTTHLARHMHDQHDSPRVQQAYYEDPTRVLLSMVQPLDYPECRLYRSRG